MSIPCDLVVKQIFQGLVYGIRILDMVRLANRSWARFLELFQLNETSTLVCMIAAWCRISALTRTIHDGNRDTF